MRKTIVVLVLMLLAAVIYGPIASAIPTCGICQTQVPPYCTYDHWSYKYGYLCDGCPTSDVICKELCDFWTCAGGGSVWILSAILDYCGYSQYCD